MILFKINNTQTYILAKNYIYAKIKLKELSTNDPIRYDKDNELLEEYIINNDEYLQKYSLDKSYLNITQTLTAKDALDLGKTIGKKLLKRYEVFDDEKPITAQSTLISVIDEFMATGTGMPENHSSELFNVTTNKPNTDEHIISTTTNELEVSTTTTHEPTLIIDSVIAPGIINETIDTNNIDIIPEDQLVNTTTEEINKEISSTTEEQINKVDVSTININLIIDNMLTDIKAK